MTVWTGLLTAFIVAQHRLRQGLRRLATELGWIEVKKPWFIGTRIAIGSWNGRRVALRYWPPGKAKPPFLAIEVELPLAGRFELRGRPEKDSFFNRPLSFFRPPVIELFGPEGARLRAWGDDRTLVDRLLSLPGVGLTLELNRPGDGVLTLKKGVLRIRRSMPRYKVFDLAGGLAEAREIARAEWDLIAAATSLG